MEDKSNRAKMAEPDGYVAYKALNQSIAYLIIPKDAETNEDRKAIFDENKAKFRCNKAFVRKIVNIETGEEMSSDRSIVDIDFKYCTGEYVHIDKYNKNKDMVCGAGIHYFKTEEMARNFHKFLRFYMHLDDKESRPPITADAEFYTESGKLLQSGRLENNRKEGIWMEMTYDMRYKTLFNYVNGLKHGLSVTYKDGLKVQELMYNLDSPNGYLKKFRYENWVIYTSEFSMKTVVMELNNLKLKSVRFYIEPDDPNIIVQYNNENEYETSAKQTRHSRKNENGKVILTIEDLMRQNGLDQYI